MSENQSEKTDNKMVVSQRFVQQVEQQFTAEMGREVQFSDHQMKLAQHLFLRVDSALKDFEADRIKRGQKNKSPLTWDNVNMSKMAIDAVDRINLGLDALVDNHIHPVPYFNSKLKKYDMTLTIGFKGLDYYKRKCAIIEPVDIRYELIHDTDNFKPIKKSLTNDVESYEFEITNPFDRGPVIGGFGYIVYEDPTKNKLILVTKKEFDKAKAKAPTKAIWNEHEGKMQYKTLVRRTTDHLDVDPEKTNAQSYARVDGEAIEGRVRHEIEGNANSEVFDIDEDDIKPADDSPQPSPEPSRDEPDPTPAEDKQPESESTDGSEQGPKF